MNRRPFIILAPTTAAFAAWMISGSPLPMTLTFVFAAVALISRFRVGEENFGLRELFIASTVVVAALLFQIHLFRAGSAFVTRSELPIWFHPSLAALWWAALLPGHLVRPWREAVAWTGGLGVLAAAVSTDSYEFGPWRLFPVAALPLALWTCRILRPRQTGRRALALFLLAIVLFLSLAARYAEPAAAAFAAWMRPDTNTSQDDAPAPPLLENAGGGSADGAARRLPRDGEVKYRNEILVMIQAHSPTLFRTWMREPLYLRTSTLALFESEEVLSPLRSGRWMYDLDDGNEDRIIPFTRSEAKPVLDPRAYHTLYVRRAGADHLPLLDGTRAIIAPAVYEFADDWYQMSPSDEFPQFRYTAIGGIEPVVPVRAADLEGGHRIPVPAIYLQRPPTPLSGQVAALCGAFPKDDALEAIRDHLQRRNHYSLRFDTPEESTALAEFFFGHGRGHCEHYAVATVLMLRSLGIPSRVAYGYAGGLADPQQRVLAFRDRDFHAWAEILTPDNQWHIFDTTPQAPGAAARLATGSALPPVGSGAYQDLSDFDPSGLPTESLIGKWFASTMEGFKSHFLLISGLALALLAALWIRLARKSTRGIAPGPVAAGSTPPQSPVLRELERLAHELTPRRKPGQTWREYLAAMEPGLLPQVMVEAVDYHYLVTYGGGEARPAEEPRLVDALRKWRKDRSAD